LQLRLRLICRSFSSGWQTQVQQPENTVKGAFFTPTVAIAGQTINYITFKSDNLVLNVTAMDLQKGVAAVTLNNGLQKQF
jgi:hypothetical protein